MEAESRSRLTKFGRRRRVSRVEQLRERMPLLQVLGQTKRHTLVPLPRQRLLDLSGEQAHVKHLFLVSSVCP